VLRTDDCVADRPTSRAGERGDCSILGQSIEKASIFSTSSVLCYSAEGPTASGELWSCVTSLICSFVTLGSLRISHAK